MPALDVPTWSWTLLAVLVIAMLAIDLFAHRGDRAGSRGGALAWTAIWIAAALLFGGFVWLQFGAAAGEQFLGAYVLEKSLSVDNLFVFVVIFTAFRTPRADQRRVLSWGIAGALVARAVFIALGAAILHRWHEVTYVFGAILIATAWKALRDSGHPDETPRVLRWLERWLPWTRRLHGHRFVVREGGRRVATPLLAALIAIEVTDVVFALDSIPAAFALTDEPFLIYSSNAFAVLGLRALYVAVAGALAELRYLRFGLAAVLAFAGAKMLAAPWLRIGPALSVAIIVACLAIAVIASRIRSRGGRAAG